MAKHSYLKLAVLLLIITGCEEYKYSIEMKSCDEGMAILPADHLPWAAGAGKV